MNFFWLIFKNKIKNLIRKRKINFFIFAISIFLIVGLFAPLFQFQILSQIKNNNFLNKSVAFDYRINLPSLKLENKEVEDELIDNEFKLKKYKNTFKYNYSPYFFWVDIKNKKNYLITRFSKQQTFNQLVNSSNNEVINIEELKDDEVILNTKFVDLNSNFEVGNNFYLGDKKFKVKFAGERISDYSLNLAETLKNSIYLESFNKDGYFENFAKVFVNKEQYDSLLKKFNKEHKQQKNIYIKFYKSTNETQKKEIIDNIKSFFSKKWNNSNISIHKFDKDFNSGLKIKINNLFNIFIITFFSFLLIIILVLFIKFVEKEELYSRKKQIQSLIFNGLNFKKIILIDTFTSFFIIFCISIISLFFGTFLSVYFYEWNFDSSFFRLKKEYFNPFFMISFLLILPVFFSFTSYIYQIYFYKKNLIYFENKNYLTNIKIEPIFVFIKKWFPIFFSKIGVSTLLFFNKINKKIFLFFLTFFSILLFFLFLFIKISFSNFVDSKNFFPKNIKSISKLNSLYLKNGNNIEKKVNFVEKNSDFSQNIVQINDFKKTISKILSNDNLHAECIYEIFNSLKSNIFRNDRCGDGIPIMIKSKDFPDEKQRKLLESFKIEKIFVNVAPYDEKTDLPSLLLKSEIVNPFKEKTEIIDSSSLKYTLFFSKENNWINFFDGLKESLLLQGIKFNKNGEFYLEKDESKEYILLPESYKNSGFKVGDQVIKRFYVNDKFLYKKTSLKRKNNNLKNNEWLFTVAGFIPYAEFNQPISVVNYSFLSKNEIINSENSGIYNFIFSNNEKSYLKRNLIIDIDPTKTDLKDFKNVEIINSESSSLSLLSEIKSKHFKIYEWYFLFIILVFSLILFLIIVSIIIWKIKNDKKLFLNISTIGFPNWKWNIKYLLDFSIFLFLSTIFAILFGYFIFELLSNIFSVKTSIFLIIFDYLEFFWYFLLFLSFVLFITFVLQKFVFFKKTNKIFKKY